MGALINICILVICSSCLAEQRPNIVVIVADDFGYNDVSFHGSDQIPTPNIDALAYGGIILNNYYVSPICTPTRGTLMSGRYPIHTGLQHDVILGSQPFGLPLSEKIMPQYLKELGYRTHIVGKWHLGMFAEEYTPTSRGFETHYGYLQGAEDYYDHTYKLDEEYWGLDWRRNSHVIRNETNLYSTDLFTGEAVGLINNHNTSEPLFLYLAHQAVHCGNPEDPLQAPQHYVNRFPHIKNYHRKLYAGMVAGLDDSVGAVVKTLTQRGMINNTIIVFTTDNGGPANGYNDNAANNFPLRGVKDTLWEGGVRGVGFIHSALLKQQGYVSNHMLHVSDWLPTLYRAAGGDPGVMENLDGFDQWEALSNKQPGNRTEILHNIDPLGKGGRSALRVGDYKLLLGDVGMDWSDWYPPWQDPEDTEKYHVNNTAQFGYIKNSPKNFMTMDQRIEIEMAEMKSLIQKSSESYFHHGQPVRVNCGIKPANASSNCDPLIAPCLYHIPTDPCEYNNIADQNKNLVIQLMVKLMEYGDTMVPPLDPPYDPAGNPKYHNNTWVPWVKL